MEFIDRLMKAPPDIQFVFGLAGAMVVLYVLLRMVVGRHAGTALGLVAAAGMCGSIWYAAKTGDKTWFAGSIIVFLFFLLPYFGRAAVNSGRGNWGQNTQGVLVDLMLAILVMLILGFNIWMVLDSGLGHW